jgi:peptide/nickel transport system permease protein
MSQLASEITDPLEPQTTPPGADEVEGRTPWQLFWARLKQDKVALGGAVFIFLLVLIAFFGGPLAEKYSGHDPNEVFREAFQFYGELKIPGPVGPSPDFVLGADSAGRDLFVRLMYGARTSLQVAILATGLAVSIGVVLGIIAGFFGGKLDTLISRTIDIILSLPYLVIALGITAACSVSKEGCLGGLVKPGLPLVTFVIVFFSWPYIARIVRGNTLSLREKEFIEASRSLGASNRRIMFKEVLPNLVAPILVYATLIVPSNIIFEASLSYLGMGLPQSVPSWGRMLSDAQKVFETAWWMMLFPGLFLVATTLAFNLLGDGLRDALDPRTGRN